MASKKTDSFLKILTLECPVCKMRFSALKEHQSCKLHKDICKLHK